MRVLPQRAKVTGHVQAGQSFGDHLPGAAAQNTKGAAGAAQCGNHLGDIDAFTARIGADGSNAVYAVRGKGRNFNGFIQCRVQGDSIDHEMSLLMGRNVRIRAVAKAIDNCQSFIIIR